MLATLKHVLFIAGLSIILLVAAYIWGGIVAGYL